MIRDKGRSRVEAKLETHRKYIDIQFVISGVDEMGWRPLPSCGKASTPYDAEKDAALFESAPDSWVAVGPGAFAVFFPEDAHAPLIGAGEPVRKLVVKVRVELQGLAQEGPTAGESGLF